MSWQILIIISVVTISVATLYQRVLMKDVRSDPISFGIVFQFFVSVIMFTYGSVFQDMYLPNLRPLLFNLILEAVLYSIVTICVFRSLKTLEASIFTVINSMSGLVTVLASSIFLGEILKGVQWLGALGILGGIILVSADSVKLKFSKGEAYAFAGALSLGLAVTNDRFLLQSFELYAYMSVSFLLPSLLLLVLFPSSIKKLEFLRDPGLLSKTVIYSVLYGVGILVLFGAFQNTSNSSPVVMISKVNVVLVSVLAIIFLKERENVTRKLLGALVSFGGLLLLIS